MVASQWLGALDHRYVGGTVVAKLSFWPYVTESGLRATDRVPPKESYPPLYSPHTCWIFSVSLKTKLSLRESCY